MLKRISVADVELGMFVHKLEGSWFKHPFWRSRFLLEDPMLLHDLQTSAVDAIVIDTSKGLDLRPVRQAANDQTLANRGRTAPAALPRALRIARSPARPEPPIDLRSTLPTTTAREFGLARQVAGKSRKVVSRIFLESRLGKSIKAAQVEPVIEDVFASIQRNPHAFNGLMRCKRDNQYVYRHALAVSALMISLGRQMKLSPTEIREAGMAGLLMDVGIGLLPVDLSQYGGDYRNITADILNRHVQLGYEFLVAGGGIPEAVLQVCQNHHELMDGSGYPNRLSGDGIDRLSRMAAICDTYDSMVSDTAEGTGMDPASSLQQMAMMKSWFDPAILQKFVETMGIYPIGSVVLLATGRLAMVTDQDPNDHTRPQVRPFFSVDQGKYLRAPDIFLAQCYGEDHILETVEPSDYGVEDFPRIRERLFEAAHKSG